MAVRIYYLDDEPDLLEIFSDTFSSNEIVIETFTDPEAAIARASSHPPDLMFVDFRLPNTTGLDVARKLSPSFPKVLVTGDISVVQDKVFAAYLEKPAARASFENIMRTLIRST